jgi:glyoxylase-like metal-dependent hydrolase (beta-lactamase superfamily II)
VLEQYYLGCLAHASYLIADPESGQAAVVDPQRDVEQYVTRARELGCRIGHVLLTHLHADFLAGHLELREREGATIHLGARARAEYPFSPLADGDAVTLGDVRLVALETPGHSPESISILVYDLAAASDRPYAVLTGDTLFIGDVGRPDLRGAQGWTADRLANMLYDSLHEKLAVLPDETLVYPGHGAGSLCGRSLSSETVSTIGAQRRSNYALGPLGREEFVAALLTDQPDAPPYFDYDAALNAREHPTLEHALERELRALSLEEVLELVAGGAQVLDTRDPVPFEDGHLRGSLNVGLGGAYATWCGSLLEHDQPVVLVAAPGREAEAAVRLGRIGFDSVVGYLDGGPNAFSQAPELIDRTERVTAVALADELAGSDPPRMIDVRTPREWQERHIDGALNLPLLRLAEGVEELGEDRRTVLYCASGYRSAIASSVMRVKGFMQTVDLAGGVAAWRF